MQCVIFIPICMKQKILMMQILMNTLFLQKRPPSLRSLKQFCDQSPTKLEIRNAVFDMKSGKKSWILMG